MGIKSFSEDYSPFQVNQKYINQDLIEEIKDSSNLLSDKNQLRKEFKKNGYLFIRNFMVGNTFSIREFSVMVPSCIGTLKSTLTSTIFPDSSISLTVLSIIIDHYYHLL